ncbi:hypothetical protein NQ314_015716 [Rhamnusium bicolor]|uniref:Anticodon-binding domain-containing protein n=1 Tax=Rhamnusium bicolor TaxID=1586634 RepID=A0AAV8WYS7_9CUCU|nr:hypothetical protein NQ314_015716 [Rhamnusium bicolor]
MSCTPVGSSFRVAAFGICISLEPNDLKYPITSPGRYLLTDIKTDDTNTQSVEILANYPWGSQLVETLICNSTDTTFTIPQLQFKEGKKLIKAHIIRSEINLSTMFLNSICDAFEEPLFQEKPREMLRFHRKLAPYKISFGVTGSNVSTVSELNDLALYLCKQLRTNHISTLLLPSSWRHTLEAQYKQYDQLGIPYNVVLNENTLKNGIAQLRSRDTTLKEQVHVTDLETYVEQLFKNY